MPRGSGIYEDEPRDHRKTYKPEPGRDEDSTGEDPTPDDSSSELAQEPSG
ncbi:hypothetical protein TUM20985_49810 [Mycobacterium antarcticum]|nr:MULTISPECIES: hypothetical protein [unclassified Mycolicibacterium]BDX34434.1 hypothetical protein TUM20985_49810 [Mycolicibacterium sp. TUM20985]GLP77642.1 hypothetical protein TUM20983_47520 [Mycolicibacterium sp. TUM20983]GLP81962.1 hypothetical protein TUM20984_33820 [Mycolicibacterium sp. TUM20984]